VGTHVRAADPANHGWQAEPVGDEACHSLFALDD
jgi:hypothetical protein